MPSLPWSEAFELGLEFMDETHHEFVDLLAAAESAQDADLAISWRLLVDHTADHFNREDDWMRTTGFSTGNCHSVQHHVVLQVLREGSALLAQGNIVPVRQMIRELADWFPAHAQTMDAALALHLRSVGFDAASGEVMQPQALPAQEIHGCGGACSAPPA